MVPIPSLGLAVWGPAQVGCPGPPLSLRGDHDGALSTRYSSALPALPGWGGSHLPPQLRLSRSCSGQRRPEQAGSSCAAPANPSAHGAGPTWSRSTVGCSPPSPRWRRCSPAIHALPRG